MQAEHHMFQRDTYDGMVQPLSAYTESIPETASYN